MPQIDETKYNAQVANAATNVKISSTVFKAFAANLKSVIDQNSPEGMYDADEGTTDAYAVTLDPAPSAYYEGMTVRFKANTANTGTCTLNVNSIGAKTIKKNVSDDMETGDIAADQIIVVVYDGTNFQFVGAATGELKTHKADYTNMISARNGVNANALINGNFDVAQRGTSFTDPATGSFTLDRWKISYDGSGVGLRISQESAGLNDLDNKSKYFFRYDVTTAGTSNTLHQLNQLIEDVRTFANQKCTLSFYAKADSARDITAGLTQNFGTGGSSGVALVSSTFSLTTTWVKYFYTFTLASIAGKTIGTDDLLQLFFNLPAGATFTIDIAQVQLCAGDTALPFQPRSFGDVEHDSLRYCFRLDGASAFSDLPPSSVSTANQVFFAIPLPRPMRVSPSLIVGGVRGTDWVLRDNQGNVNTTGTLSILARSRYYALLTVSSGTFTAGTVYEIQFITTDGYFLFDSEL